MGSVPRQLFVVVASASGGPSVLERVSALPIRRISPTVVLGEYHDAFVFFPDRMSAAFGISAPGISGPGHRRVGVRIVDVSHMKILKDVETGIAAEGLGWLTSQNLVAVLQYGGLVLINPKNGKVTRRWPFPAASGVSAESSDGLAVLFDASGGTRLALVTAGGRLRSVLLQQISVGPTAGLAGDRPGLVADPMTHQLLAIAGSGRIAQVDLATMSVRYHDVGPLGVASTGQMPSGRDAVISQQRYALSLGNNKIAIVGQDLIDGSNAAQAVPAGLYIVDTGNWSSQLVDRESNQAVVAGGHLFAYQVARSPSDGNGGLGLTAYSSDGQDLFNVLADKRILDVQPAGDLLYARTPGVLWIIDAQSGAIRGHQRFTADFAVIGVAR